MARNLDIPVPRQWPRQIKSAFLHIVSLASSVFTSACAICSMSVIERFIKSLMNECTRTILVSLSRDAVCRELSCYALWYNQYRLHSTLDGKTLQKVYVNRIP